MARTELPNGVILPAEYSDDWYEDMTSNLTKLDDVIGSDSEKLNSNDVAFLRMSSAALTDGGTGNFSDLNSSNKLKTGDYVLDSGRKLYQIVSVDSTNETFTVGNSLFKVTAESDLAPVAKSGDYDDLDNKPDLKPVATSGDYDDLTNKPNYGILRMTSETLSDSGSGAISNLNSDSKLAAGDYVLDAALKVFLITAVSAPNYTVGTSLFQITNASALAAVATSGSYDDLNNLPAYGITRFVNAAITDNSNVAFANISSVDKIKAGDFLLDNAGKMYLIASVDTVNETAAVTTPLTQLAVDSGVMHLSGNETASGIKTFSDETYIKSLNFTNEVPSQSSSSSSILPIITTITYGDSSPSVQARLNLRVTADGVKAFYPNENNQYALGLQSRKWSEVRAIQYYYGSSDTEFSDKFVTTDTNQTVLGNKTFSNGIMLNSFVHFTNTKVTKGTIPQNTVNPYRIYFGSGINYANSLFNIDTIVTNTGAQALTLRSAENVVNGDDTRLVITYNPNLTQPKYIRFKGDCIPDADNTYECGTNDNKWKSFNGLNPGALSLPDLNNGLDISGYITNFGAGTVNEYTPIADGWISIANSGDSPIFIRVYNDYGFEQIVYSERNESGGTSGGTYTRYGSIMIPCIKNIKIYIIISPSSSVIVSAKFYPCQGNV